MPVDSSIYFQQQTPDFIGNIQKGLSIRDMMDQQALKKQQIQKEKNIQDAYKQGIIQNQDGTSSFDGSKTLSALAGYGYGKEAQDYQQQLKNQQAADLEAKKKRQLEQIDFMGRAASGIKTQQDYDLFRNQAKQLGLQPEILPEQWGPEAQQKVNFYAGMALTAKDQMDQANKKTEIGQKDQEIAIKKQEAGIKQQNANTEAKKANVMAGMRSDDKINKMAGDLKKDLDADAGRTGNFGVVSRKLLQAQNLETLANAFPDGNIDSRQIEELSLGLANMLAGSGGTSRAQVEGLIPHTWTGKMANVQEWLTSNPTGAGQQEFVKRMMHTIEREKEMAQNQLNQIRESRLTAHQGLAKLSPETYRSILQGYGMSPDDYGPNGLRKTPKTTTASHGATNQTGAPQIFKTNDIEWAD